MKTTLTIQDESLTGQILNQIALEIENELITVADLIKARVTKEVEEHNKSLGEYYKGFIQPTEAEQTLNGYKLKNKKAIDAEKQVYIALDAFQNNSFFILLDDRQAESLEEEIIVNELSNISFVKLTPLVGG